METQPDWKMVTAEFFEFHWSVAVQGYHRVRYPDKESPEGAPAPYLFNAGPLSRTPAVQFYQPMLECPDLLYRFAKIDLSEEENILDFANRYGLLTKDSRVFRRAQDRKLATAGEPLDLWDNEIKAMRFAVELRDLVKKPNHKELSRAIEWKKDNNTNQVIFHEGLLPNDLRPSRSYLITSLKKFPLLLKWFQPGEWVLPATYYLAHFINTRLLDHVTTQLLWTPSDKWRLRERDIRAQSPDLRVVPRDLLGVLWLQLALGVEDNIDYRRCQNCGKVIVVGGEGPEAKRKNRKWCSDACKIDAWRKRADTLSQGKIKQKSSTRKRKAA